MAYSNIDNPELNFQTKVYTGNGSTQSITLDGSENMQPDWVWIKRISGSNSNAGAFDSVRGATKVLSPSLTDTEETRTDSLTSFNSDGFSLGADAGNYVNSNSESFVSFNWKAGGSAPAVTYTVKVVSDSGNKYRFDDFGTSAVTLDLQEGGTYTFDQSDSSNSGHPLRFYTASDKSGGEYTTGVTTTGTAGSSGAKTVITVAASAPTLYYQCSNHAGMGGQANTNSLFGSSNFSGSIQSTVSANVSGGFSIVSYTGTGSNATVGHGLNSAPTFTIIRRRDSSRNWFVSAVPYTNDTGYLYLHSDTSGTASGQSFFTAKPTNTVLNLGTDQDANISSGSFIAYCFHDVKGYLKVFQYEGNSSNNGANIFLGFSPAWLMVKPVDASDNWVVFDNKRHSAINDADNSPYFFYANKAFPQTTDTKLIDLTSTGFKVRSSGNTVNRSSTFIGIAFAENPLVNSNGIPVNAK